MPANVFVLNPRYKSMLRYATGVGLSRTTVSDLDMGRQGGRCCWRFFNGVGLSQPVSVSKDGLAVRWVVGCWRFEMHKIKTFACNKGIWKYKNQSWIREELCICYAESNVKNMVELKKIEVSVTMKNKVGLFSKTRHWVAPKKD